MKKKKVLMVYGAGGSIKLGMPSVLKVDEFLEEKANAGFTLVGTDKNLYSFVRDTINDYKKLHNYSESNFEEILYVINQLSCIVSNKDPNTGELSKNSNYSLNNFVKQIEFPLINRFSETRELTGHDFRMLYLELLDEILKDFREKCLKVKQDEILEAHCNFLQTLNEQYELGIFTTNYDNLILKALPDLFTGFDKATGNFLRKETIKRDSWDFVYHVHGSVHFDMPRDNEKMHSIKWLDDYTQSAKNSKGRSGQTTTEGLEVPNTSIIVGYDKLNQIQKEPFRVFYSALDALIYDAAAIIFVGYGFGDHHINNPFHEIRTENSDIPIIIIDYAKDLWHFVSYNSERKLSLCEIFHPNGLENIGAIKESNNYCRKKDNFLLLLGGYPDSNNDLPVILDFIEKRTENY